MDTSQIIVLVSASTTDRVTYRNWLQDAFPTYTFLEVDCGKAALEICQQGMPTVILLDDRLPDLDGLNFLAQLKQQTVWQPTPVVVLGEDEVAVAVQTMKRGAQDYLVKPKLTSAILCRAVEEVTGNPELALTQPPPHKAQSILLEQSTQVALKQEDFFASAILAVVEALVVVLDCEGRIVCFNRVCEQVSGYSSTEVMGQLFWDLLLLPEEIEAIKGVFYSLCSGQFPNQHQNHWITKDGTRRLIAWSNTVWVNRAGTVEYVIGTGIDVTDRQRTEAERQQAEALLQRSEATNRALIQAIPDLLIRMTCDGECLGMTSCRTIKGAYPVDAVQDSATFAAQFPDLYQQKRRYLQRALETRELQIYEQEIQLGGSTQFEEVRIVPSGADEVLVIVRDISERKRAEIALQTSEARFHAFMNNSPTAAWITDASGHMLYVSQTYCQMFNLRTENLIGKTVFELFPAEIAQQFLDNICWVAETGQVKEIVENAPKWDGTIGQFLVYKFPLPEPAGQKLVGGVAIEITEQLQAEQALRQLNQKLEDRVEQRTAALKTSEAVLQAVFNQAGVGINLASPDGRYLRVNQTYCNILGYTPEELLQKDFNQITCPEDQEIGFQQRRRLFAGEIDGFSLEKRYIRKDGSLVWVNVAVTAVYKTPGEVDYAICIVEDIDCRKQAEAQLRLSEARYRAIVEDQTELIARFAPDTTILFVNEAFCRYLGVKREEIIGTSYAPQVFEADREQVAQQVQTMSFENPTVTIENRLVINGEVRWTQWINRMLFDDQGNFIEYQSVGRDVTDRKRAEEKLRQQLEQEVLVATITQRIRESLNLSTILNTTVAEIQHLLQASRVLVYRLLADGSGQTVAESRKPDWQSMFDLSFPIEVFPPESYQRYVQGRIYVLPDRDQEPVIPCMFQFMQTFDIQAKLVAPIIHQEVLWGLLIVHECGAPRQWQAWEVCLLQQLANQLAIATKQSELYQQLQAELREREQTQELLEQANNCLRISNLELARATRHKDEFLANMSHELRTPLNAILGMSEALLENICGPLTEQQQKAITTIEKSGIHLLELINDILDLAKIEAGKMEFHITSVAISPLCDSSLSFVKPMADKKGIQLRSQIAPDIGLIEADERRLQQVLINLLSNAVKFTPTGGSVNLEVWIEQNAKPQRIEDPEVRGHQATETTLTNLSLSPLPTLHLAVSDTGIGIAEEHFDQIFQPFRQIDSSLSRQYPGTGLGLALVWRIVTMHQGTISIESKIGEGSRFTIRLPNYQGMPRAED